MDWTEINIEISADQVDEAAAIAQMVVPYGIYIEDYSDLRTEAPKIAHIDLIDEELLQKDVTKALIHIYISPDDNPAEAIAFLREKYTAAGIANSISTTAVKQEEWATAWKQYYHPQKLGNRLVVCPSWAAKALGTSPTARMPAMSREAPRFIRWFMVVILLTIWME